MTGDALLLGLAKLLPEARRRFDVQDLWVFGSVARGESGEQSDLDLIVDFHGPATFDRFMGLKIHLEDALGVRVDLATRRSLHPRLRTRIEREAILIA